MTASASQLLVLQSVPVALVIAAAAFLIGLLVLAMRLAKKQHAARFPYSRQLALLTPAELAFYAVLREAVGDRLLIAPKVRLGDVLTVDRAAGQRGGGAMSRINSKHVDFVLCDPGTTALLGAVELDDRSHRRADRIRRDEFVNEAFRVAKLPLYRVETARAYSAHDLRAMILGKGR